LGEHATHGVGLWAAAANVPGQLFCGGVADFGVGAAQVCLGLFDHGAVVRDQLVGQPPAEGLLLARARPFGGRVAGFFRRRLRRLRTFCLLELTLRVGQGALGVLELLFQRVVAGQQRILIVTKCHAPMVTEITGSVAGERRDDQA